jgi:DNA-binding transcriptional ArsR family regulator
MEDVSSLLVERLLDKALENLGQDEKLAFLEKLFNEMPPAAQQDFLLKLVHTLLETGARPGELQFILGKEDCCEAAAEAPACESAGEDGPLQACCRILTDFAAAPVIIPGDLETVVQMFNGLADETRLKIVKALSGGEFTVEELVDNLGIAQSTTSHHLRVLKDVHLIEGDKRGRYIYYRLVQPREKEKDL